MNKRNSIIGVVLILLGISMYLKKFHIGTESLLTLFLGVGLLYAYYLKREQPFIIFGGIFTAIGSVSVLHDVKLFHMDMTFEILLIALGVMLVFMYYSKHIHSFIFPGMILPAFGIYLILLRILSDRYAAPSIFLLLGFAFYAIYFIAYMGKSSWPLIAATVLLLTGIAAYAANFELISWHMIYLKREYIGSLLMIAAGVLILLNLRRKKS